MKYVIAPILLVAALAFGQTWVVEQVDSTAASGSPVELVEAADGRLWAGYQTKSGVVRVACFGDSGWSMTDVCAGSVPGSVFRPLLSAGPHGELCLSCYRSDSGWLYQLVGDTWHAEFYPFADSYHATGPVAYDTTGRLYTVVVPNPGDFWVGHETDSGWSISRAVGLFVYGWFSVDVSCLAVAQDCSPWCFAYVSWMESQYIWGQENALMHYTGDTWRTVASGSAVPLAMVPHGDSVGWVTSDVPGNGYMLCDGDTVGPVSDNLVAGLAYTAEGVPLIASVPRNMNSSAVPVFAFKTNRWHTERIPGPSVNGGIDIETDTAGQVVVVYSTLDSGLWCARGTDVVGVEESPKPQTLARKPEPTVLSGSSVLSLKSSVIFDAMGRRVLNPRSGIFFVREAASREPSAVGAPAVRKVVVTR